MRVNLYASLPHYADHLWPIWEQLPEQLRGVSIAARDGSWWGSSPYREAMPPGPVLVASYGDATSGNVRGRDLVYVEHGAGQTYGGDPAGVGAAGLSGTTARGLDRVRLFVCPNEQVAERWRARGGNAVVAGCPKLDRWHVPRNAEPPPWLHPEDPVVAVTFHWDCTLLPETRTAWPEYDQVLPELAAWARANHVRLLGHGHPRIESQLRRRWAALEVTSTSDLALVLENADVLVADNTSAMYEFASLGRPVVAVNSSEYRRHVEHGLRFWSHVPGVQVDRPADLVATVAAQLADRTMGAELRAAATTAAYAHTDGHAAERAARAIMETLCD